MIENQYYSRWCFNKNTKDRKSNVDFSVGGGDASYSEDTSKAKWIPSFITGGDNDNYLYIDHERAEQLRFSESSLCFDFYLDSDYKEDGMVLFSFFRDDTSGKGFSLTYSNDEIIVKINDETPLEYSYEYLFDRLVNCSVVFSETNTEIFFDYDSVDTVNEKIEYGENKGIYIGASDEESPSHFATIYVDEIKLFDFALSDTEIEELGNWVPVLPDEVDLPLFSPQYSGDITVEWEDDPKARYYEVKLDETEVITTTKNFYKLPYDMTPGSHILRVRGVSLDAICPTFSSTEINIIDNQLSNFSSVCFGRYIEKPELQIGSLNKIFSELRFQNMNKTEDITVNQITVSFEASNLKEINPLITEGDE